MSGPADGPGTATPTLPTVPPPPAPEPGPRPGIARWAADLAMGARFAVNGGRESWARTIMTAVGVGLGVTLLLLAASVPTAYQLSGERADARDARSTYSSGDPIKPGPDTISLGNADTTFRDRDIRGVVMAPDGGDHRTLPTPPGVDRFPGPGEMWLSPALKKLLDSDEGKLLRDRFPYRTIGVIGDSGLSGPAELTYYAGISKKAFLGSQVHIKHWGAEDQEARPLDPMLLLLIVVGCVVLLLPVLIFIATATRFGGERRDRRLAALRLVGADIHMTRRIAAGESLFGSLLGLAIGTGMFLLVREFISGVAIQGISFFRSDIVPTAPLALAIAVAVPASAVIVTQIALRGIAIEPLGVVRHARPKRRRLWWRLLLPVLGVALLLPLAGNFEPGSTSDSTKPYQAAVGAVLLLIGVTALLPWVVEAVVERFGGKGSVPWQLATRRLQLSSGTAARAVSGITVAVAGALALQMLFASVESQNTESTRQDPNRAQLMVDVPVANGAEARDAFERYRATKGVRDVLGATEDYVSAAHGTKNDPEEFPEVSPLTVADCTSLRELIRISRCANGDVFLVDTSDDFGSGETFAKAGAQVNLAHKDGGRRDLEKKRLWTIPRSAIEAKPRQDPSGRTRSGIFATPGAFDIADLGDPRAAAMIRLDPKVPDAAEYVRNASTALSPVTDVMRLSSTAQSNEFKEIRRALFISAVGTLLLIGASMIVTTLEQLRERKRLLSVLVAFGTRRTTLSWSVLWQTAVPVVLGMSLSIAGGLALGVMLLKMVRQPLAVDWSGLGAMIGIGSGVILLVTLVSMGPLWRMMRPEGLRTE